MPGSYKCHAALIGPCGLGPVQRTAASTLPQIHSSKRRWGPLRSFDDSTSAATCEEETIVTAAHDAIPQAVPPTESLEAAVALPPPQPNPEDSSLPYPSNSVVFSTDGIILSLSVLVAARLGRLSSQEARLDVRRVQRNRERFRALSSDLRQKREAWKAAEAQRLIAEEAQRVAEAAARAKEEARVQEERRRQYEEEAARQKERMLEEQKAARKMYEAQQALLDAEYNARVEQEQRLIAEAKQRAKEEEERRRQEAERQRLAVEEERRKREEAERAEREAAARRKIEERKRLEKEKRHFAVRTEGQVRVERPPKGTLLQGRLQKEASVRVAVTAGSLLGGAGVEITADFTSLDDAVAAMPALVGAKARAASDGLMSALRLQALAGDGPMSAMEQPEQEHWMAMTAARTAVVALKAGEAAVENFRNNPKAAMHAQPFQVRTEIGVLAPDHPQGPAAVLGRAIALVEEGSSNQAVEDVLADSMQAENEQFYAGLEPLPNALAAAPKALGAALELAHFLARALHDRPAKSSDAPAWFEACASLVRQQLTVLLRGAPADSLAAPAAVLSTALGPANPISVDVAALAEANVSAAERARRAEQERAYQVELAAKLLEEEWPDAAEIRAARLQERESKTPIAERVWALRNVAGTLAMGGPGERSRARQLLEQAVLVKQEFAGAPDHPAALPELVALADVLASDSEWAQDAAGVASLLLRVLGNIASAYAQAGDPVSAALLMEAGLRQYEEAAGVKSAAVRAATRRADQLLEGLSSEQRAGVAAQRGQSKALVAKVAKDLTEQLGAYQEGTAKSRAQDWDERGAAMLSSLAN